MMTRVTGITVMIGIPRITGMTRMTGVTGITVMIGISRITGMTRMTRVTGMTWGLVRLS